MLCAQSGPATTNNVKRVLRCGCLPVIYLSRNRLHALALHSVQLSELFHSNCKTIDSKSFVWRPLSRMKCPSPWSWIWCLRWFWIVWRLHAINTTFDTAVAIFLSSDGSLLSNVNSWMPCMQRPASSIIIKLMLNFHFALWICNAYIIFFMTWFRHQ